MNTLTKLLICPKSNCQFLLGRTFHCAVFSVKLTIKLANYSKKKDTKKTVMDSTADVIFSTTKSGHCSCSCNYSAWLQIKIPRTRSDCCVLVLCVCVYVCACVNHKYNIVNMASVSFPLCFLSTWSQTIWDHLAVASLLWFAGIKNSHITPPYNWSWHLGRRPKAYIRESSYLSN